MTLDDDDLEHIRREMFEVAVSLVLKALIAESQYEADTIQRVVEDFSRKIVESSGERHPAINAAMMTALNEHIAFIFGTDPH